MTIRGQVLDVTLPDSMEKIEDWVFCFKVYYEQDGDDESNYEIDEIDYEESYCDMIRCTGYTCICR